MKIKGYNKENIQILEGSILFFKQVKGKYISYLHGESVELDGKEMRFFKSLGKDKSNEFTLDMLNYMPFLVLKNKDGILELELPISDVSKSCIKLTHEIEFLPTHNSYRNDYKPYNLGSHLQINKYSILSTIIKEVNMNKPSNKNSISLSDYLLQLEAQLKLNLKNMEFIFKQLKPLVVGREKVYNTDKYSIFVNLNDVIEGISKYQEYLKLSGKYGKNIVKTSCNTHILSKGQELLFSNNYFYLLPSKFRKFKSDGFEDGKIYVVDTEEIPHTEKGLSYGIKEKTKKD